MLSLKICAFFLLLFLDASATITLPHFPTIEDFQDSSLEMAPRHSSRRTQVTMNDIQCYNDTNFLFEDSFIQPGGLFNIFASSGLTFLCLLGGDCDFAGSLYETQAREICDDVNGRIITSDLYMCASEFNVSSTMEAIRLANVPLCVANSCPSTVEYQEILDTGVAIGLRVPRIQRTLRGECAPRNIDIDWIIPPNGEYENQTARVGDTIKFNYGGSHNVYKHPSGTCDETNSVLVGGLNGPASYTFTRADAETNSAVTFACNVGSHCEAGQILHVNVERLAPPPSTDPMPTPAPVPTTPPPGQVTAADARCFNSTIFILGDFNLPGGLFRFSSASETLTCLSGGNCNFAGSVYEQAVEQNCAAANGRVETSDLYICRSDFGSSPGDENVRLANMPLCVAPTCRSDITYQQLLQIAFDLGLGQRGASFEGTFTGQCVPSVTEPPAPRITMAPTPTPTVLPVDDFAAGIANGEFDVILDVRTRPEWIGGHIEGATFAESLGSFGEPGHTGATPADLEGCESCTIAVYCRSGSRATAAIDVLLNSGFQGNLYNALGTIQWRNAGYQLVTTRVSVVPPCTTSDDDICVAAGATEAPIPTEAPIIVAPVPTEGPISVAPIPTEAPSGENTMFPDRKVQKPGNKEQFKMSRVSRTDFLRGGGRKLYSSFPEEMDAPNA